MNTLSLKPYGLGGISLLLDCPVDEVVAHIAGASAIGINCDDRCPRLVLSGNAGAAPVSVLVNGVLDMSAATFDGADLSVSGNIGSSLTLKGGLLGVNLTGLHGLSELVSATDNFPTSILLLNFGLARLKVNASSFAYVPGYFGFNHSASALPESDQGDLLDLCIDYLTGGGDVNVLQIDFNGGSNAALSAANIAKVATLNAAGASISHR